MDEILDGGLAIPPQGAVARFMTQARPVLRTALTVAISAAVTLAVNAVLLLIAIPIGIAIDQLFWSIAVTELVLLVVCLVAGAVLALRARRGAGAGLVLGWAAGYVGLIGLIVALAVAAVVIVVVAWVALTLLWVVANLFGG